MQATEGLDSTIVRLAQSLASATNVATESIAADHAVTSVIRACPYHTNGIIRYLTFFV